MTSFQFESTSIYLSAGLKVATGWTQGGPPPQEISFALHVSIRSADTLVCKAYTIQMHALACKKE
eukprot:CAMPEP_0202337588 /NCGR_PEP_ID=MMETSP1126-20121109/214_1 /ASSEMBLY_ACC=CAM_ASM_000457 /TAXON_ID=3047 /ORGANISM="Dunaliella tertiolecta, Strain CCMP1320" /LENGTH=64 /DNA_ID=CAMNT_0048927817 /DNA_START=695 /DNA_END=889 /DNA_ORIENTATION=-